MDYNLPTAIESTTIHKKNNFLHIPFVHHTKASFSMHYSSPNGEFTNDLPISSETDEVVLSTLSILVGITDDIKKLFKIIISLLV